MFITKAYKKYKLKKNLEKNKKIEDGKVKYLKKSHIATGNIRY